MEAENRFKAIFEYVFDGLIIFNKEGIIENINPAATKLFEYDPGELTGQHLRLVLFEQVKDSFPDSSKNYSTGISTELVGKKKSGTVFPCSLKLTETNINGKILYIGLINDLTSQKLAEEYAKMHISKIEKTNHLLQDLAFASAHDLQEPLRKIKAFGERLKYIGFENLQEEVKDSIEKMLNSTLRMQSLLDGLLSFTRITSNSKFFSNVDLSIVLNEVLSDLEVSIGKSKAVITVSGTLPTIEANATQIRQIFQNLILNALKFKKEHEAPVITIYYSQSNQSDIPYMIGEQYVTIYFEDNGIGFDEKHKDKIFNIFQRLGGEKYEGSGMGLAICRKIVIGHRGEITAQSQHGKGSTFIVKLPVNQIKN